MAAFEVIALDTATPQLRAPGASDTYTFPRAVEMPLGTANGVLFLNGSKVVTSGSGLTFDGTNLGIGAGAAANGVQINASNGGYVLGKRNGTNAWFIGDTSSALGSGTGTIFYNYALGAPWIWQLDVGGEQMRLTSTGLGIGTSSPGAKLDVNGETRSSTFSSPTFSINSNPTSGVSTSQSQIRFQTTGADFYIGTEGAVGGVFFPGSTAYAAVLYNAVSTPMQFYTAGTLRATLDTSGNLGLGVTPSAWGGGYKALQVTAGFGIASNGANAGQVFQNAYYDGTNDRYIGSFAASKYAQINGAHAWYNAPSWDGTGSNAISFTQAMTLDASGNLGIGTTSPTSGFRLDVQATTARQRIESTTGTNQVEQRLTNTGGTLYLALDNSTGSGFGAAYGAALWHTGNYPMLFATNNTERARITSGGDLLIGATGSAFAEKLRVFGNYVVFDNASYSGLMGQGSSLGTATASDFGIRSANAIAFLTNGANERARITAAGNVVAGGSIALATNATDGFLYVPTCAGTPTGTPTAITGMAPIVVNTTNNKLYFYSGGAWRDAGP